MRTVPTCLVLICIVTAAACTSPRIAQSTASFDGPLLASEAAPPASTPAPSAPPATQAAQQTPREDRRDVPWEVTLAGGGTNDEDFDIGNGSLDASVGYYFNEVVELVARQSVFFSDDEGVLADDEDVWAFQSRIALDLHLPLGRFVPYVGASVGYLYGDIPTDETGSAGPEAGVKIYLQRAAFLQIGAEWQFFFDEQDTINDAFEEGQLFYNVGFGLRF